MINVKEACEIINLHEDIRKQVIEFDRGCKHGRNKKYKITFGKTSGL